MDSFLRSKNQIMAEERTGIRASVPAWRVGKRRQALAAIEPLARQALTSEELRIERRFDRQGYAWGVVSAGTLIATVGSWQAFFVTL